MRTVITPDALRRSKGFREVTLRDSMDKNATHDEAFLFIYPSPDPVDQVNGDGQLIEIIDYERDLSGVYVEHRREPYPTTPDTKIWVRD